MNREVERDSGRWALPTAQTMSPKAGGPHPAGDVSVPRLLGAQQHREGS